MKITARIIVVATLCSLLALPVSACPPPLRYLPIKVNLTHDVSAKLVDAGVVYIGDLRDNIESVELSSATPVYGEALSLTVRFKHPVQLRPACHDGSSRCSRFVSRSEFDLPLGKLARGTHRIVAYGGTPIVFTIR